MTAAEHADAILRAAGSSLANYTMPGTRAAILVAVQAALLEGVRIGIEAAANELSMQSCCCSFDVRYLDPAAVLARHGGA